MLGAGALRWPRGMVQGGRWEGGSGWGTCVYEKKNIALKMCPLLWLGVFIKLQAQRLFHSNSIQTLVDLVRSYFVSMDVVPAAWQDFCIPELDFPGGSMVKNPLANTRDARDAGLTPGSGRSSGGGDGNPLQCSCLENSVDRGAWRAAVHGVTKTWTWLNTHTHDLRLTSFS